MAMYNSTIVNYALALGSNDSFCITLGCLPYMAVRIQSGSPRSIHAAKRKNLGACLGHYGIFSLQCINTLGQTKLIYCCMDLPVQFLPYLKKKKN